MVLQTVWKSSPLAHIYQNAGIRSLASVDLAVMTNRGIDQRESSR